MLSSTYQQASFDRPECRQVDPENRLLWRFPRRRLDLEAMRDTLLFVSGRLDRKMGGRPVDVAGDPKNRRRTVYGMVDRQSLPAVFRAFDFASPDQSAERRPRTTVPQQALFSMNAPFVIEQAKALAARPDVAGAATTEARVAALYRAVLARSPAPAEVQAACAIPEPSPVRSRARRPLSACPASEQLAQVLLMTNELLVCRLIRGRDYHEPRSRPARRRGARPSARRARGWGCWACSGCWVTQAIWERPLRRQTSRAVRKPLADPRLALAAGAAFPCEGQARHPHLLERRAVAGRHVRPQAAAQAVRRQDAAAGKPDDRAEDRNGPAVAVPVPEVWSERHRGQRDLRQDGRAHRRHLRDPLDAGPTRPITSSRCG